MSNITINNTLQNLNFDLIVRQAYIKFKYKIFYDSKLLIYKKRIADYEKNGDLDKKLLKLVRFLNNKAQDKKYLDELLLKISYIPIVKKVIYKDKKPFNEDSIDLNYFIDLPIELHIIDTIWTILIASIIDRKEISQYLYGSELDEYNLFVDKKNRFKNIKWDTKSFVRRYIKGYNRWINNGIKKIDDNKLIFDDITLISSDLKRFFYNIEYPFEVIENQIIKDYFIEYNSIDFITLIIKKIYNKFFNIIKTITTLKIQKGILPIGLASSMLISNLYLNKFDQYMFLKEDIIYYGRYVDDMIIIYNHEYSKDEFIEEFKKFIKQDVNLRNISLNEEKTKEFHIKNYNYLDIIDKIYIYYSSRDNDYYGNEETEEISFTRYFNFERKKLNNNLLFNSVLKEEDLLITNIQDTILFMNYIFDFVEFNANTKNDIFNKIISLINESTKFGFWKEIYKWGSIYGNNSNKELIKKIIKKRINTLTDLKINDVKYQNYDNIVRKLKKTYKSFNKIALILGGLDKNSILYISFNKVGMLHKESIIKFLINNFIKGEKFLNNSIKFYKEYYSENYLPFIHLWEVMLFDQLVNMNKMKRKNIKIKTIEESIETFKIINNIEDFDYIELRSTNLFFDKYKSIEIVINGLESDKKNFIVSHPNINLDKNQVSTSDILSEKHKYVGFSESRIFFKNLIHTIENKTNLLVLPELYVKLEWLYSLGYISHQYQTNVTFGLENIVLGKRYLNLLISLYSFKDYKHRRNLFVTVREKNFYSYEEKRWCKSTIQCKDHQIPEYFLVKTNDIGYTDYLCFEITDILSRALFKGKCDIFSVPMLNKDTSYFDNIIQSLSRDLSCCVITSNSASWGNSSIILPKHSYSKVLTEFKGGFNNYLVSTEVPIYDLIKFNKNFNWHVYYKNNNNKFKANSANYFYYKK